VVLIDMRAMCEAARYHRYVSAQPVSSRAVSFATMRNELLGFVHEHSEQGRLSLAWCCMNADEIAVRVCGRVGICVNNDLRTAAAIATG
jgi:hypothetical protein